MCKSCHTCHSEDHQTAHQHAHNHGAPDTSNHGDHTHSHDHNHNGSKIKEFAKEIVSGSLLVIGLTLHHFLSPALPPLFFLVFYVVAILPVGLPIIREMFDTWRHGSVMNEFTLMVAAAVGAFIIGEFPEGVAVLLFYSFGEKLEDLASDDVRTRIRNLLGRLPNKATVVDEDNEEHEETPANIPVGTMLKVRPGERVAIDAVLCGETPADFDTSAITGESVPRSYSPGEEIPSGVIPADRTVLVRTTHAFKDSSMSRIMEMIENAQASKSPTETMLRRITRWYTPTVFILAVLLFAVPYIVSLFNGSFIFEWEIWLNRSLVFLVCSCPCALVVSIPLSYFSALGAASKEGLLFKGARHIDTIRNIKTIFFDKTGTLTTGEFHISSVYATEGQTPEGILSLAAALDKDSTHPLAVAVVKGVKEQDYILPEVVNVVSIPHGMKADYQGKEVLVGSVSLMASNKIDLPAHDGEGSEICVAIGKKYIGSIFLLDTIKPEAAAAIAELHRMGVEQVTILSGDRPEAVGRVANEVGADNYEAALLPADKQRMVAEAVDNGATVAFAGDGVNDAPSIATADAGIAMGALGTDIAMESADVVISSDNLSKIPEAIRLSKRVKRTVAENVSFALGVKAAVMILGAFGIASLWAAVFADTGVTLITILWTLIRIKPSKLR